MKATLLHSRAVRLLSLSLLAAAAPVTFAFDGASFLPLPHHAAAWAKDGADDGPDSGDDRGGRDDDDAGDDRDDDRGDDNGGHGGDDGPDHDIGDDHGGGGNDDGPDHDIGDDKGGQRGDTAGDDGAAGDPRRLKGGGVVAKVEVSRGGIEITYADGWKEEIENGRYELKDPANRTVIERPAKAADEARLFSALR